MPVYKDWPVSELKPHPLNRIYQNTGQVDDDFLEGVRQDGILSDLLVAADGTIISGHTRWEAAKRLGYTTVRVKLSPLTDPLEIEQAVIGANRQRDKTNEEKAREYRELCRILNARQSRQGSRTDLVKGTSGPIGPEVKPTVAAASDLGLAGTTAKKSATAVEVIDELQSQGETQQAEEIRTALNQSVDAGYKAARKAKQRQDPMATVPAPTQPTFLTLQEWDETYFDVRSTVVQGELESDARFNSTNDNIEWASWSWNPVTGCLHNCAYCYARDIAQRFYTHLPEDERFSPVFYPERINAPKNTPKPNLDAITDPVDRMAKRNVFVCSMADLFGKWVPEEWIRAVIDQAVAHPEWNFLFLTKFPIRMAEFEYPKNTWIGTTVDSQYAVQRAEKAFRNIRDKGYNGVAWLSCEPMMERLTFEDLGMFDWVVMGGSSRSTQTEEFKPPFEWIVHLWNQAKTCGLPVYMKTNLISADWSERVREYPANAALEPI